MVRAVVLLIGLTLVASKIGTDLSTNTSTVANLDVLDLAADLDDLADDFVAYAERKRDVLSPSSGDGVNVTGADATSIDRNVDIVLLEFLERKLLRVRQRFVAWKMIHLTSLRVKVLQFLMSVIANASVVSG